MTDLDSCDSLQVTVVINPGDDVIAVRRLNAVHGYGRAIVRPTPGGSAEDLALDVLAAVGRQVRVSGMGATATFRLAAVGLVVDDVSAIVVDRAHLLPRLLVTYLLRLARDAAAALWLVCPTGGWNSYRTHVLMRQLEAAGAAVQEIPITQLIHNLPPGHSTLPIGGLPRVGPHLFQATCRRRLPPSDFQRIDQLLSEEIRLAHRWITSELLVYAMLHPVRLMAYLRERCGPPHDLALIRLYAMQIAMRSHRNGLVVDDLTLESIANSTVETTESPKPSGQVADIVRALSRTTDNRRVQSLAQRRSRVQRALRVTADDQPH